MSMLWIPDARRTALTTEPPIPTSGYLAHLGATYAGPEDDDAARTGLGPRTAAMIDAIAARLIPGDEDWPSAGDVGAAGHVAAVIERACELRPAIAALLHDLGEGFAASTAELQDAALRRAESDPALAPAFRALYEWVCEAYYRHPTVTPIVLARTGFDLERPLVGAPLAPFDVSRLDRVRALPPRYRAVPA